MNRIPVVRNALRGTMLFALVSVTPLLAQRGEGPDPIFAPGAEAAMSRGRFAVAESILYAASARAPHDPALRAGLGMYLASRGHIKIGTVLLEEARQFGANGAKVDAHLAQMYPWIGDWSALAALRPDVITSVERARARWLTAHAPATLGPDSVVVAMEPVPPDPNEVPVLGRIAMVIGGRTILADIAPNIYGLVLPPDPALVRESQLFGKQRIGPEINLRHDSLTVAAVRLVSIGALTLTNVAASITPGAHAAIGLDVLASLMPTFDADRRRLTLRRHAVTIPGETIPFILDFPGIMIAPRVGQTPMEWDAPAARAALSGVRWTLDLRSGTIVRAR